jgi:hypothetical protein
LSMRPAAAERGNAVAGVFRHCLKPGVSSRALMVHSFRVSGRRHYGPDSTRGATTTEAVRRAIQRSQESLRTLAARYGINQKTVAKWKRRSTVQDVPTGPREPRSTSLTIEQEATSISPKCKQPKASSIYLSPSTGPASLPSCVWSRRQTASPPQLSSSS